MNALRVATLAAPLIVLAAGGAAAQGRINCESRNYQYQFCATPEGVTRAQLVDQRSRSPCVEGRSWGWERRGIWVSQGCEGVFDYQGFRAQPQPPSGPGGVVSCESRNYQYEFCGIDGIVSASMVRQKSRTPCVLGRNWGWRQNGIWVSEGCEADFQVQTSYRPLPGPPGPGPNLVHCESNEYRYNFCQTGRIRSAQLVEQRSQAPCIQGRTWGFRNDGIWVDNGCEGAFRVR